MSVLSVLRRTGAVSLAAAVATTVVSAGAAQAAPADRGAAWLSHQLSSGLVIYHDPTYGDSPDYGLTIDTGFALKAIGGHSTDVQTIRRALAPHVDDYTTYGSDRYAGSTAKLLSFVEASGGDPKSFGGVNLVRRLTGLVVKSGPAKGRIADKSQYGDYANTIGQVLAVRGLTGAGSGYAGMTRRFLLEQQCRQGYFRLFFSKPSARNQSCTSKSPADPDATAYAVVELWKASRHQARLRTALEHAVTWLVKHQRRSGAFLGGTTTASPNSDTTGLAGWALGTAGRCSAARAAAGWVLGLQVGPQPSGSALAGQRGAIAYDRAAMKAGEQNGITSDPTVQDQWQRATSQAAPALLFRHGC